jgi:murein DD-endopeptidase MepM/ murein hydrolase activator NlpD
MTVTGLSVLFYFLISNFLLPRDEQSNIADDVYTKGFFVFPIEPGSQSSLSGSFGDIRFNHFHAGLDIRTGGREGKSVYSAAAGYVSRIKVTNGGYGNALYITHSNGLTSVYGHLKEYNEIIKAYLVGKQYETQTFEIDLFLLPNELSVTKGELVAFSGNTGGSGGPHLHFEIRDKEENTLDPALFGFDEVIDNVAPVIEFFSLRCLSADARINGEFGTFDFKVSLSKEGDYIINSPIKVWGDIGIEVYTYDKAQTSPFKLGIKYLEVKKDNLSEYKFELGKLAFHNKIDMNLHANYERMVNDDKKLHKAYVEEGNSMEFYDTNQNKGVLSFRDNQSHQMTILLKDTYQNTRTLSFDLTSDDVEIMAIKNALSVSEVNRATLSGTFVKIVRPNSEEPLNLIDGNFVTEIEPSYASNTEQTYIIDLNETYFSKFMDGRQIYDAPFTQEISSEFSNIRSNDFDIELKNALYSPLYINFRIENNLLILDEDIHPLKGRYEVKWMPEINGIDSEKDASYLIAGKKPRFTGGTWENNAISFRPKEFGTYQVLRDTNSPLIVAKTINSASLVFIIKDELSGIKSYECYVNGEWVLMEYEYKNGLLWSERLTNQPFQGEILLRVKDNCNNEAEFKTTI